MDLSTKYFITCIVLIIALGGGGYYYHTITLQELTADIGADIRGLTTVVQEQSNEIVTLKSAIAEQSESLHTKISTVQEEAKSELKELTGELSRVEMESTERLGGIERELLSIDVETKGFTTIIEDVKESVVSLQTNLGIGSGVVVGYDGYILTNYHVIEDILGPELHVHRGIRAQVQIRADYYFTRERVANPGPYVSCKRVGLANQHYIALQQVLHAATKDQARPQREPDANVKIISRRGYIRHGLAYLFAGNPDRKTVAQVKRPGHSYTHVHGAVISGCHASRVISRNNS